MSYGLMCLKCRRYIVEGGSYTAEPESLACKCHEPMPSLDGVTEYHPNPLRPSDATLAKLDAITAPAPNMPVLSLEGIWKALRDVKQRHGARRFVRMTLAQLEAIREEAATHQVGTRESVAGTASTVYGLQIFIAGRDDLKAECMCRTCCLHLAPITPGTAFNLKPGHFWL
jgi:hypothetical protein